MEALEVEVRLRLAQRRLRQLVEVRDRIDQLLNVKGARFVAIRTGLCLLAGDGAACGNDPYPRALRIGEGGEGNAGE